MNSFRSVIPCPPVALFIMILDFPTLDGSCAESHPAFFLLRELHSSDSRSHFEDSSYSVELQYSDSLCSILARREERGRERERELLVLNTRLFIKIRKTTLRRINECLIAIICKIKAKLKRHSQRDSSKFFKQVT